MTNPMQDAELRAGVEPLDQLLDERAHLVEQVATLWALYGPGGTADHSRKNELARLDGLVRAMAVGLEKKLTEPMVEAATHAHKDYLDFVAKMTTERAEFFRLNAQLEATELRINRGQALLRMFAAEARLTP
jgi:hypothetical protein